MVMAGYSNTLCCGDLNQISHSMLMAFEQYWQDHEEARDALLKTGMAGLIQEVYKDVENHVELILKCHVERVEQMENGQVALTCSTGSVLMGDAVVVTCHPKYWKDLMTLPEEKGIATEFIGAECAMKVFLEFQGPRLFPDKLQTLVCADQPVPELWFRDLEDDLQLVVCFLTSSFAKDLLKASQNDTDQMTKIILNQLSTMFSISIQDLELALTVTHHQFWDVGYMFPKVGLQPHHLEQLAEPYGSVYFAGEATHTHACCTVQAAMETGVRAAKQIKQAFDRNE
jgi:monoamine oxidase